jgi:hypothetical protein
MQLKKLIVFAAVTAIALTGMAQDRKSKKERREARKEKINSLIRQEEEGNLVYNKHFVFAINLKTNGYGIFLEKGFTQSRRFTTLFQFELAETKHPKEDKRSFARVVRGFIIQGNPFIYGKQNYFYQAKLGVGQQVLIGNKGNKNGVSVRGIYAGGAAIGLLRPYYLDVYDAATDRDITIKYNPADTANAGLFLSTAAINGGTGLGKGWGEMQVKPGVYAKTALRFDYGRFNEVVSALEIGLNAEYYFSNIPIMIFSKEQKLFFNAYIAIAFGKRK